MTAPTPLVDLDDGDALVAADTEGVLRSAAMGVPRSGPPGPRSRRGRSNDCRGCVRAAWWW